MGRISLSIPISDVTEATLLEELCWTVPGVESITYQLGQDEVLKGLEVISANAESAHAVAHLLESQNAHPIKQKEMTEEDWAESWKQYWHVTRLLPHLVIQPTWEPFTPEPGDTVLKLDPGAAFGTGTHETTQLMLYLLSQLQPAPPSLLDVGTGSGILAMAAAKWGVQSITAIDNDPNAVQVAQENCLLNDVAITCSNATLETVARGAFECVLANILAPVIIDLMPQLARVLGAQGQLFLSGITPRQVHSVKASVEQHGLKLRRVLQKNSWCALVATHAR